MQPAIFVRQCRGNMVHLTLEWTLFKKFLKNVHLILFLFALRKTIYDDDDDENGFE